MGLCLVQYMLCSIVGVANSCVIAVALWVWLTLLPTLMLNSKRADQALTKRDYLGWTVWGVGFIIEAIADYQKYVFRSDPANANQFITHGLWSMIRHPNYLGEILMWFGLFLSASSTFKGAENLAVLSPVFVALLLTKLSGVPFLERRALKRWKDNTDYMEHVQQTYRLIPYLY